MRSCMASVFVYRLGPNGPQLARVEVLDDAPCVVCQDTGRIRASGKAVPVTIACPFCRRRNP